MVNASLFYLAFSVLVIALFPLGVIDLAAGFLFGVWAGFPLALATKTSGSVLCFVLSRRTCRSAQARFDCWCGQRVRTVRNPCLHVFLLDMPGYLAYCRRGTSAFGDDEG